uniref:hypothetical protein n=1 Tax=Hypnea flava TaxID=1524266 RepID=UPI0027DA8543|nr:hypothetical protein REP59_pgp121 [Hypnea flava]WCH54913.1 hypothetical protein [Hypnea flava]
MTKKTVNDIYIMYKFFTTNIYHTLKKTNQVLISFFYIFFIFVYKNNIKNIINSNKQLAFQTYIIHFKNKISIDNLEIKNLKSFLKIFPNYHNKITKNKSRINIKKVLEYLKNTGIINQLDYFIININNLKYYIVQFRINHLIKKIEIQNYQHLQIPQKLLINILKNSLGKPINYFKVNNSINKIYAWYINNGFSHTYIKLKYNNQLHSLHIQIFEGQIIDISLICKSKNIFNSSIIYKINKILTKELGLSKKSIFNKKKIDIGIIYLKKIHFLKTCNYKIKKHKQGLLLKIEYSIPTNHYGYIYNHTSHNTINHLLYNILNYDYSTLAPIYFHILDKIVKKIIIEISQINKLYEIYLKYKNNFKKIFNFKYIKLHYYFHYIDYNYKINLQIINNSPEFDFLILIPYIKVDKIILNFIKLNLYQKIDKTKRIYPQQNKRINNIITKNKIINNIKIKSQGNFIIISQRIFVNFDYKFQYRSTYNLLKEKFFHIKIDKLKTSLIRTKKIKRDTKILRQKITSIKTYVKYNNLKCKKFLEPGKVFILELLFLRPQKIIKNNIFYQYKFNKNIKIKYYEIILLPNYLKFIKKHAINIFININSFIINNNYENILHNINNINSQIYFQKRYTKIIEDTIKNLYQIEYHISLSELCSYYIFSNFNNKLYDKSKISKYNCIIGLGIQIHIPIKTLPKIRFEYTINKYSINHYQLRFFSSCNNSIIIS